MKCFLHVESEFVNGTPRPDRLMLLGLTGKTLSVQCLGRGGILVVFHVDHGEAGLPDFVLAICVWFAKRRIWGPSKLLLRM